jgi:DnaJ-class molecular chaperone
MTAPTPDRVRCETCAGTGMDRLGDHPCTGCGGYGYLPNPIRPRPA